LNLDVKDDMKIRTAFENHSIFNILNLYWVVL